MDPAQAFLVPQNSTHRQYEALRAYFVDRLPGPQVAARFGYALGSLRQLVHQFRQAPQRRFFAEPPPRGVKACDAVRDQIVRLRKQNLSVYDISEALKKDGVGRTSVAVAAVLKKEGFAKLPRRMDEERPPGTKPTAADRADVRLLSRCGAGSGQEGGHFRGGRGPGQWLRDAARNATRSVLLDTGMNWEAGSQGGARLRVWQRSRAAS